MVLGLGEGRGKPISDREVVKLFQRYLTSKDSSEIDQLRVSDLYAAEARLALQGTNPQFIAVIRSQIARLEQEENRMYESRIRVWNLVTGLILGLVIAGISALRYAD